MPEGVDDNGITFRGFIFLLACFVQEGLVDDVWKALRTFGYDNGLRLKDYLIAAPIKRAPEQVIFCLIPNNVVLE